MSLLNFKSLKQNKKPYQIYLQGLDTLTTTNIANNKEKKKTFIYKIEA